MGGAGLGRSRGRGRAMGTAAGAGAGQGRAGQESAVMMRSIDGKAIYARQGEGMVDDRLRYKV